MLGGLALAVLLAGVLAGAAVATLTPPPAFVLDADGVTQLTLEQAGILNPATTGGKTGRQWALVLGKALFWDQQAGSDGNACASCHFHAGADTRLRNQINPGFNDLTKGPDGDSAFGSTRSDTNEVALGNMPSGAVADSNYVLKAADMPLHQLQNERDRNSLIRTTTNDRVSSLGAFDGNFTRVKVLGQRDKCTSADPTIFHAGPYAARQVEPRNTPTAHNAVFFHRNFWDGRANNLFNGVGVFGMRDIVGGPSAPADPNKRLIVLENGVPTLGYLKVENASLASQAVGPPLSDLEMSCDGRTFPDVGRKLLFTIPLLKQKVSKTDSVLGPHVSTSGQGLAIQNLYSVLIMRAFDKKYWAAPGRFKIVNGQIVKDPTGYLQMETNFSMFWGLAIMLYEATLVADQSEFDTYGVTTAASCLTVPMATEDPVWRRGCEIFFRGASPANPDLSLRGGNCSVCHGGTVAGTNLQAALSQSAFQATQAFPPMIQVPRNLVSGEAGLRVHRHDLGFMSIGLRPVFTDLINGGTDPYGNPLSFSRQYQRFLQNGTPVVDPPLQRGIDGGVQAGLFAVIVGGGSFTAPAPTLGADGAAKSPILRNVALTPPYFSWGGYPSLRQAMKLYNRGFNRRDINVNPALERAAGTGCLTGDNSGTGPVGDTPYESMAAETNCATNTTGTILPLGLLDCDPESGTGLPPAACTTLLKTPANDDLASLERFLKSLTDPRVQCDKAPFDHPELKILNGHTVADSNHDGKANDIVFSLPAVGESGYSKTSGYCIPNAGDLFAPGMQGRSGGAKVSIP